MMSRSDSSYINLRIVNSNATMTRAAETATAAENAVYDGILCIFEGDNESSAELKTAVVIDQLVKTDPLVINLDNSTSIDITQRLAIGTHPYNSDKHLYVLALLNTTSTGFKVSGNDLLFDGVPQKERHCTISDIQSQVIHSVGSTKEHVGLFMSNAPQDGYIMPEVTSNYLFDTPSAANSGGKLIINVERAAARVRATSDLSSGDNISNISLYDGDNDGDNNPKAKFHKMTWTVNKYNTQSYTIRKGSTAANNWAEDFNYTSFPEKTYTALDFNLYPQKSYSGDNIYIGENTTDNESATDANLTEVIVEVQVKDNNNMLMHECFKFEFVGELITSSAQYFKHLKGGWYNQRNGYNTLKNKEPEEVFKYATIVIKDDGTVDITLTNDSFSDVEKADLKILEEKLEGWTRGYRDGKMYYTYKIKHDTKFGVVRNNAYNLKFQNLSISGIGRPTP